MRCGPVTARGRSRSRGRLPRAAALAASLVLAGCAVGTRPFRTEAGRRVPGSIAEETHLRMRGAREYLLIRGRNARDPVVLFVHGGPGGSETPLMRLFDADLENHLVMAYWDQRGAGKSYDADIPPSTMTIEQLLADMDQVVDYLRRRLGQPRILILGHSWGSALGLLYVQRHPEKVAGYVGVGQVADNRADERHAYEFALAQARTRGNRAAVDDLERIGPPPYGYDSLRVRDHWLEAMGGTFHRPIHKWAVAWHALWLPEFGLCDFPRLWRGMAFSQRSLWPEFARLDLTTVVPCVDVPVTFLLGRYDERTSAALAAAYLASLRAPQKHLVWLEHSAHNGPFEEPEAFQRALLATASPRRADYALPVRRVCGAAGHAGVDAAETFDDAPLPGSQ